MSVIPGYTVHIFLKISNDPFSAVGHLNFISKFCEDISFNCSNGGRSEKLALLEQFLEDTIERYKCPDTVGVVFVERRITVLALHDYFRTRLKYISQGKWHSVEKCGYYRNKDIIFPDNSLLSESMAECDKNFNLEQVEVINMTRYQVEDAITYSVLHDYVPKSLTIKQIMCTSIPCKSLNDSELRISRIDKNRVGTATTIVTDMALRQCTQIFKYLDQS